MIQNLIFPRRYAILLKVLKGVASSLSKTKQNRKTKYRGVAQLVAREVWDFDVAGSNPVTPTRKNLAIARFFQLNPAFVRDKSTLRWMKSLRDEILLRGRDLTSSG